MRRNQRKSRKNVNNSETHILFFARFRRWIIVFIVLARKIFVCFVFNCVGGQYWAFGRV
jgi:hypothetical protein